MGERRWARLAILILIGLVCLSTSGCAPSAIPSPTLEWATVEPTPLPTFTATLIPTATSIPTAILTPTPRRAIATSLPTSTATPVPTRTPVPTATPVLTRTPMPTATPTTMPSPTPTPEPTPTEVAERLTITIVYDNNEYDERLETAWGFSCLVERGDLTLLFDTGGDAETLLSNMATLGLDPAAIDTIVLSHIHGDHVGGLGGILAVNEETTVYLPRSFPASFKEQVKAHAHVVEVHEPMEIAEGIYTTGELGAGILEQSLVLATGRGLVVITGCAHPGAANIVAKAREITAGEVYLVMGGFHLGGASQAAIEGIVEDFRKLGVQKVAPCHCSGDLARSTFEKAYGENFVLVGVGSKLEVN